MIGALELVLEVAKLDKKKTINSSNIGNIVKHTCIVFTARAISILLWQRYIWRSAVCIMRDKV